MFCSACAEEECIEASTYTLEKNYSCAIANFGIEGMKGSEIEALLMKNRKVHTVAIEYEKINGVRVTPNVYTSFNDLDQLVEGIKEIIANKKP